MKDGRDRLSAVTVGLHWLIALAVIGMIVLGLVMEDLPRDTRASWVALHRSIGIAVLVVASLRILWRWRNGFPVALGHMPAWQHRAAQAVHLLLLAATVLLPVTGILLTVSGGKALEFFGLQLLPGDLIKSELLHEGGEEVHGALAWILIAVIAAHVAGALKHHLIDRNGTLRRMTGRRIAG